MDKARHRRQITGKSEVEYDPIRGKSGMEGDNCRKNIKWRMTVYWKLGNSSLTFYRGTQATVFKIQRSSSVHQLCLRYKHPVRYSSADPADPASDACFDQAQGVHVACQAYGRVEQGSTRWPQPCLMCLLSALGGEGVGLVLATSGNAGAD